jgi:two-component system, NtrC family, sensor kinase
MATTTKKGSKRKKANPRRAVMKKPSAEQAQTNAELRQQLAECLKQRDATAIENVRLFKELQERNRDLTEALEQQTATGEVLRVIASLPTDLQPVLDTLIANAVRLTGATKGHVWQLDGEVLRDVANYGESSEEVALLQSRPLKLGGPSPSSRAILEQEPVQVSDAQNLEQAPDSRIRQAGMRTMMAVPLMREGTAIGSVTIWRDVVKPFTDRQISLLQTFADQAVIAIENVRLFKELQERNRELTEALEQQTATSEILRVIARSPTDVQPVLDVVVRNIAQLCGIPDANIMQVEGNMLRVVAAFYESVPGSPVGFEAPLDRDSTHGRAIVDRQTIHIHDFLKVAADYPTSRALKRGYRTILAIPLLREDVPIGVIGVRRMHVEPFTEKQIAMAKTFADQAVIAIENVRLFKEIQERNAELREALEHQTATSEVLGIISRSPTDVQPVLDAIVESAARV